MTSQTLQLLASVYTPDTTGLVRRCCYHLVALRVEGYFRYLVLVAVQ